MHQRPAAMLFREQAPGNEINSSWPRLLLGIVSNREPLALTALERFSEDYRIAKHATGLLPEA